MRTNFSIWFNDFDAKTSVLYRSAMTLRTEEWRYVENMQDAKWWVIQIASPEQEQDIINLYKKQVDRPIVVIIKESGDSEFHKSWSVLRMPFNFVTFFQWVDDVISRGIQAGKANQVDDFLASHVSKTNEQATFKPWLNEPFRLTAWPNVERYGRDMKLVLYCSKMLRGYCKYNDLIKIGIDPEVLQRILNDAAENNILHIKKVPESLIRQGNVISSDAQNDSNVDINKQTQTQQSVKQPITKQATEKLATAKLATAKQTNQKDNAQVIEHTDKRDLTFTELDALKPDAGANNQRSMSLFNSILSFFNSKK